MAETALIRRVTACHHSKRLLCKFYRSLVTDSSSKEPGPQVSSVNNTTTTVRTGNQQKSCPASAGNIPALVSTNASHAKQLGTTLSSAWSSPSSTTTTTVASATTTTTTTTIATTMTTTTTTTLRRAGAAPAINWNFAMTASPALASGTLIVALSAATDVSTTLRPVANLSTSATADAPSQRGNTGGTPASCPFSATRTLVTNNSADKNSASGSTGSTSPPLSMKELPGPKGWPFLGTFPEFLRKENRGCIHKVQPVLRRLKAMQRTVLMRSWEEQKSTIEGEASPEISNDFQSSGHYTQLKFHKKYGRMFKLDFGPHTNVCLADPSLVEEFMRMEGKHPNRPPYQSWVLYNELRKKETGLMTAADEKWHKYRSAIAPRLLRPQMAAGYTDRLSDIVDDLINRIHKIRNTQDHTVPMLQNELYKWATESVGSVLFGRRLGCLQDSMPQNIQDLINAVGVMFVTGHQMAVGATIHQFLNTSIWQKHVSSSDTIYGLAQEFIDQRLEEISHDRSGVTSSNSGADLLTYLLSNKSFSIGEIYSNMAELFLAGLDTASNSLGFAIYLLAKYPKVQEKLQEEISRTLQGEKCTSSHLSNMPYLKAVIKESMRLYPVIPIGARITTDDIVLDGYLIPKGTCLMINNYVMSRDEMNFPEANEFIPERWFRSDTRKFHPFSVIPFGHGSRSCIGRRVAELELYLAITNICQNFWLTFREGFEVEPFLRTVLTVGEHFPIQFINR